MSAKLEVKLIFTIALMEKIALMSIISKRWQIPRWGQWKSEHETTRGLSIGNMSFDPELF